MTTTLVIIAAFLVLTLVIAFVVRGTTPGDKAAAVADYFIGGRATGYVPLAATFVATGLSVWTVLGLPGMVYRTGMAVVFVAGISPMLAVIMYVLGRRIWELGRRHGYVTPSDLLADRYQDEVIRYVVALAMVFTALPYIAVQFIGLGIIMQIATGGAMTFQYSAIFFAAFVAAYCMVGGFRAVVFTDVLQAAIFIFAIFYLMWIVLGQTGGMTGITERWVTTSPQFLGLPGPTPFWGTVATIGFAINICGLTMQPQMWSRYYAAADKKTLGFGTLVGWAIVAAVLVYLIIIFSAGLPHIVPGLTGRAADGAVPQLLAQYGSAIATGIVFSGVIAAALSTQDSQIVSLGSILVRDVMQRIWPNADTNRLMGYSKASVWVWIIIPLLIALFTRTVIFQLLLVAYGFAIVIMPATVGALYWPRGTRQGALWSILIGEAIVVVAGLIMGYGPRPLVWGFSTAVVAFLASAAVYVVVSLLTPAPSATIREKFYGRPGPAPAPQPAMGE